MVADCQRKDGGDAGASELGAMGVKSFFQVGHEFVNLLEMVCFTHHCTMAKDRIHVLRKYHGQES